MRLRTKVQQEHAKRDHNIRKMYSKLTANPDNAKTAARDVVMEKFGIKATSKFYGIIKQGNSGMESAVDSRI